jgi:drug/metabolite transporter (DMT)-like permease
VASSAASGGPVRPVASRGERDSAEAPQKRYRVSPREYHVPVSRLDRLVVRLGAAAFRGAVGIVSALGLAALYVVLFHPFVGDVVRYFRPKTDLSWLLVLLVAVPAYGLSWLVTARSLRRLERWLRWKSPKAYGRVRLVLWLIIGTAATVAFFIFWWSSLQNLPG